MLAPTSVLAAFLLGLLLSFWRPFTRKDWLLAIVFALFVDLDHLENLPSYLRTHPGLAGFDPQTALHYGMAWQGFLHTWWGLLLVVPAMLLFRSWIPIVFWGLHMFLDFVVATHWIVWGSPAELLLDLVLAAIVLAILYVSHHRAGRPHTFARHVAATFGLL